MASIYTYPEIGGLSNEDLFIVTDVSNGNSTKSVDLQTLSDYIAAEVNIGSGTVTSVTAIGTDGVAVAGSPITSSGTITLSLTNGGISNAKLTNSSITINGTTVALGGSISVSSVGESVVGQLIGGGIAVAEWNDSGVKKALIASLTDLSTGIQWTLPSFQSTSIGIPARSFSDGLSNTNAIITQTGSPAANTYAAGMAKLHNGGGFNDWYLPATWELNACYNSAFIVNGILPVEDGFNADGYYWSSIELDNTFARQKEFINGDGSSITKSSNRRVRAVRVHNV